MGLAKNALDAACVPGRTQRLRRKRKHPLANAKGSPVGRAEGSRSARQEPRPPKGDFAGTTEHQLGDGSMAPPVG